MNHTIRLINANAVDGMQEVINANQWVDCIITNFNMDYFYEDTLEDTFIDVVNHMKAVLVSDGTVYIKVTVSQIPFVTHTFTENGFVLKNVLMIPINVEKHCCCRSSKYNDRGIEYFLFFGHSDYKLRFLNPTEHDEKTCNCNYSVTWDWFGGTDLISVYRKMMELSTDHSQVILDPFMDAGDVGVAAILQDRDFIGIEISRARYDDTKARLDDIGE